MIYNKLSNEYDQLYMENIHSFKQVVGLSWKSDAWFADFYPSFGIKQDEKCDFLFYGQAVNSWRSGFDIWEDIKPDKLAESIISSNRYLFSHNHSPLDWVNLKWSEGLYTSKTSKDPVLGQFYPKDKYWTNKSFFWKVIYKLVNKYYEVPSQSWQWTKRIVWSNLYKIAPEQGNPDEYLQAAQRNISTELVKKELDEINPKFCIVLTNESWWKPFGIALKTQKLSFNKELYSKIESIEMYKDTKIFITTRPAVGNSDTHVDQILDYLRIN